MKYCKHFALYGVLFPAAIFAILALLIGVMTGETSLIPELTVTSTLIGAAFWVILIIAIIITGIVGVILYIARDGSGFAGLGIVLCLFGFIFVAFIGCRLYEFYSGAELGLVSTFKEIWNIVFKG